MIKLVVIAAVAGGAYLYQSGALENLDQYAGQAAEYCNQVVDEIGLYDLRDFCRSIESSSKGFDQQLDGIAKDSGLDELQYLQKDVSRDLKRMGADIDGGLKGLGGSLNGGGSSSGGGAASSGGCSPMKELMGDCTPE